MNINNLLNYQQQRYGKIQIDLGCGLNKKPNSIGIDILQLPGVDILIDLEKGLTDIPDNSIDEFYSAHFLEHTINFENIMAEVYRTLKPGGMIEITVPHFSNPYFYSDYTHKRFFGLYSFDYFSDGKNNLRHKVPIYNTSFQFEIISRRLVFKSADYYIINLVKKHLWTRLFNSCKYLQSFYEELFTNFIYCSELVFVLRADK